MMVGDTTFPSSLCKILFYSLEIIIFLIVARPAFAPKVAAPQMVAESMQLADIAQTAQLIATSSEDFGGPFFEIFGLGSIAALILFLSPPLSDE